MQIKLLPMLSTKKQQQGSFWRARRQSRRRGRVLYVLEPERFFDWVLTNEDHLSLQQYSYQGMTSTSNHLLASNLTSHKQQDLKAKPSVGKGSQNNSFMFESFQKPYLEGEVQLSDSKKTTSTNLCEEKERMSVFGEQNRDSLDFTFNNLQWKSLAPSKLERYSHPSAFSVVLYGLLFNHMHLQANSANLPNLDRNNKHLVRVIKEAFLSLEDQINLVQPEVDFSAIELMQLLHKQSGKVSKRQGQLRIILSSLNSETIELVFREVIRSQQNHLGKTKETTHRTRKPSDKENIESAIDLNQTEKAIRQFTELLNLRIKLSRGLRKEVMGAESSHISVSLRQSETSTKFSLKSISCSQKTN